MSASPVPFFAMESHLVARLKSIAEPGVKVLTAADLAGVEELAQHCPSYQVVYGGARPVGTEQAAGAVQSVEQRWFVIVATRNASTQLSGSAGRQDAGVLTNAAMWALLGWSPGAPFGRLRLGNGGSPAFRKGGYAYYPFLFTTQLSLKGESITPR